MLALACGGRKRFKETFLLNSVAAVEKKEGASRSRPTLRSKSNNAEFMLISSGNRSMAAARRRGLAFPSRVESKGPLRPHHLLVPAGGKGEGKEGGTQC